MLVTCVLGKVTPQVQTYAYQKSEVNVKKTVVPTVKEAVKEEKAQAVNPPAPQAETPPAAPVAVVTFPVGCEAYRSALAQYNWNVDVAMAVMQVESTCNPNADNPNDTHPTCMGSRGLFGIGCDSTNNYAGMFNPYTNIAQAYSLYASRGWQPWSFTTCKIVACY